MKRYNVCLKDVNNWLLLLNRDMWFIGQDDAFGSAYAYLLTSAERAISRCLMEEGYNDFEILEQINESFGSTNVNALMKCLLNIKKIIEIDTESVFLLYALYKVYRIQVNNFKLNGIYPLSANLLSAVKYDSNLYHTNINILLNVSVNIYNYITNSKLNNIDRYVNIAGANPNGTSVASALGDLIFYISNILTNLPVDESLSLDYNESYIIKNLCKQARTGSSNLPVITEDIANELSSINNVNDLFSVSYLPTTDPPNIYIYALADSIVNDFSYASKIIGEITNVILEYLPTIQADIAYIRTTYPDIPDVETAKSLEKILYSNVGTINEDINQTRDDVSLASGTTSQQVVQRILTGTAWASAYKQYINPVKYTEIADAIKRRIFRSVL